MQTRRNFLKTATFAAAALPAANFEDMASAVKPLEIGDYQQRIARAQELLERHGCVALYLNGGSSLKYFTGVEWGLSERMFAAILPARGEIAWICPAFEEKRARERIRIGGERIRVWQEHESPYELARSIFRDLGFASGRVAIEPSVRHFVVAGLAGKAPAIRWVAGHAITEGCRGVKSSKEIAYLRLANMMTKKACAAALTKLREGMTEQELGQIVSREHAALGARGGASVVGFGPNAALPHGSRTVRKLQAGDVVLVDAFCIVEGYVSDVTRTTVFGRPSDKQRRVWDAVKKAQEAAQAAARPGLACQQLDRAARKVVEDAGYGPGYKYFTHRLGHGIGLDGHEVPYLVEGNKTPLAMGMTFSDEPGIYIDGEFGMRLEDILVVTDTGAEYLGDPSPSLEQPQ